MFIECWLVKFSVALFLSRLPLFLFFFVFCRWFLQSNSSSCDRLLSCYFSSFSSISIDDNGNVKNIVVHFCQWLISEKKVSYRHFKCKAYCSCQSNWHV
jgi:hypothetical protein